MWCRPKEARNWSGTELTGDLLLIAFAPGVIVLVRLVRHFAARHKQGETGATGED